MRHKEFINRRIWHPLDMDASGDHPGCLPLNTLVFLIKAIVFWTLINGFINEKNWLTLNNLYNNCLSSFTMMNVYLTQN